MADRMQFVRRQRPELLRVAMRTARGLTPAQIAGESRTAPEMIEALAAEPDFRALVEACKASIDLPAEERLKEIESLALDFIEIAIAERDVRVVLFFCDQIVQGCNPAKVLAAGINRRIEQSTRPLPPPKPRRSTPHPGRPSIERESVTWPWARAMRAGAARLRSEILEALAINAAKTTTKQGGRPVLSGNEIFSPSSYQISLPKSYTSTLAILINHCRDGPG